MRIRIGCQALFAGLDSGGEGAVCAASHIRSRDGREVEFSGASANLFGVGRPRSAWGWPGSLDMPGAGSPLLFASGGAMLIHRRTFLDAGGFDPHFWAYFEDVDLGWRLWLLGHKVVYAPDAIARHLGGATSSKSGAHRRYTLWECNSLATVLKNYESGNMESILSTALLLLYKRALLAAGDAIDRNDYKLSGPRDTNEANVERLPKVSVAHLAAVNRFNSLLPLFMEERREIQARRVRSDAEILPLLGRAYEPQFAGTEYAQTARNLARSMRLFGITESAAPNRILVLATNGESEAALRIARRLENEALVALTIVGDEIVFGTDTGEGNLALHLLNESDPKLAGLIEQADAIVVFPGALRVSALAGSNTPKAILSADTAPGHMIDAISILRPKRTASWNSRTTSGKNRPKFPYGRRLSTPLYVILVREHPQSTPEESPLDRAKIEKAVRMILEAVGEDPEREGLVGTPRRIADMYEELFEGLTIDPTEYLSVGFEEKHKEMVILRDIPFTSICEHHLLAFRRQGSRGLYTRWSYRWLVETRTGGGRLREASSTPGAPDEPDSRHACGGHQPSWRWCGH